MIPPTLQQFSEVVQESACLLGTPLSTMEALSACVEFQFQCSELALALTRLENITKHDALTLLRTR